MPQMKWTLRALVACMMIVSSSCRSRRLQGPLTDAVFDLAYEADRELGLGLPPRKASERRLLAIARRAGRALDESHGAEDVVTSLNRLIFDELGFRRQVRDPPLRSMMLPHVLAHRQGTCLGLAALYLAIAEQLGLPLKGVLVPGHFFLRYEHGAERRDIELLKRGRKLPRAWYLHKYQVPRNNKLYLRSLDWKQSAAAFRFNLANALRERGRLKRAAQQYNAVVNVLPGFAEAHANLGLTYQLLGDRHRAIAAYHEARQANPTLEGIDHNLKRLSESPAE